MSQNGIYTLGATTVILSALGGSVFPTLIKSPAGCQGMMLKIGSLGSGATVQIVNGSSYIGGASYTVNGTTLAAFIGSSLVGYPIGTTEIIDINGPAAYLLACTTAASTVNILFQYSAGASLG